MVSRFLRVVVPVSMLVAPAFAFAADDTPAPPPPPFAVKAQVGYVSSHGNTDAQTANAKIEAIWNTDNWKHDLGLAGLYGKSNDIVSAEMLDAQWQSNYKITDRLFAFGLLHYNDDKFSGFQFQETVSVGAGYSIVKLEDATLDAQVGVGYRRLRPETILKDPVTGEVLSRDPGDTETGAVATATLKGMYAFNANTKLTDVFDVETGSDNTLVQNDLGLQVNMTKALAVIVGYEIRHNSSPPAPLGKNDTLVTFNLSYAFPEPKS